jgi:4-amino-4-deoxy-L-arabinose transferase-like glycosyltransferase
MKNTIFSKFRKDNAIYFIFFLGLILRIIAYLNFASYKAYDGYIYHGRVLYESKAYGRDRQFFEDNNGDPKLIDELFNNPSSPIIKVNGKEIILTATHPVGWPLQIAFLYVVFGNNNINAVLIYNFILSSFSILLFYTIAKKLFDMNIALISSLIVALNPIFILTSVRTTTETNFLFFLMLSIYFLIRCKQTNKISDYMLFGVFIGFTSFVRPVAFLYFFLFLFLFFVTKKFNLKSLFSLIAFLVVLSPWVIRNYIVFNRFIPMTNLSGTMFYQGNNKLSFESKTGACIKDEVVKLEKSLCTKKSEIEIRDIEIKEGLKFLKSLSLIELIQHEWYKIRYAFGLSPKYFLYRSGTFNFTIKDKLVYYPLFFLTLIYFIFFYRKSSKMNKDKTKLFLIIFISAIIVYLIQTLTFIGYPRYRQYLLDPFLIIPASLSLHFIFLFLKERVKSFKLRGMGKKI